MGIADELQMWWGALRREIGKGSWWDVRLYLAFKQRQAVRRKGERVEPEREDEDPDVRQQQWEAVALLRDNLWPGRP